MRGHLPWRIRHGLQGNPHCYPDLWPLLQQIEHRLGKTALLFRDDYYFAPLSTKYDHRLRKMLLFFADDEKQQNLKKYFSLFLTEN